ncbi:hypothetical protein ES703_05270 [subsurface metagenome]
MWKKLVYKVGQLFGCAATSFIAFWLITHPEYEPNLAIRCFEIAGSIVAAAILGLDFLDIHPSED